MGFGKAKYDVEEKGLNPTKAHKDLGDDGRLAQVAEAAPAPAKAEVLPPAPPAPPAPVVVPEVEVEVDVPVAEDLEPGRGAPVELSEKPTVPAKKVVKKAPAKKKAPVKKAPKKETE